MFSRDEEDRIVHELRSLRKSFSEDMLHQKCERKQFRAKPVPIESRIPLYDKILEDQAMRFTFSTRAHPVCFSQILFESLMLIFFITPLMQLKVVLAEHNNTLFSYRALMQIV